MKLSAFKSAYMGWLSVAMAKDDRGPRQQTGSRDLVLGYAVGYEAALIVTFVRSLRAVFDGSIALVVDQRPDVLELLADHDVEAIHPASLSGWEPHPVMARFAAYLRLIDDFPEAGNVLLTDVRDVVFQAEPFSPPPQQLEAYVENEEGVLEDHAFNMKSLRALVGDEMATALADKPCICVGTIIGPRDEVARFCRTLLLLGAIPRSEIGGAFGTDQAACNLAIHLGLVKAQVQDNFGRVATIGMTPGDRLNLVEGRVVNPDGSISPIVHQHDRHPHLNTPLHAHWGQGFRLHERVTPKTIGDRGRKLRQSLKRRLPELR